MPSVRGERRESGIVSVPSLTLTLQQSENVVLSHRSLDVTDNGTGRIVHEFNPDLSHTSSRSSPAEDLTTDVNFCPMPGQDQLYTLMTLASLTGAFDESYTAVMIPASMSFSSLLTIFCYEEAGDDDEEH
jgi:hypothetical protein